MFQKHLQVCDGKWLNSSCSLSVPKFPLVSFSLNWLPLIAPTVCVILLCEEPINIQGVLVLHAQCFQEKAVIEDE